MSDEKRRFTRVRFRVQAEITVNETTYATDQIKDLSIGGCLLPINSDLNAGSECIVKILMSGASSELTLQVEGKIIRCDQGTVAIKFTGIDPDSLLHLQNIVLYNSSNVQSVEEEIQRNPGIG